MLDSMTEETLWTVEDRQKTNQIWPFYFATNGLIWVPTYASQHCLNEFRHYKLKINVAKSEVSCIGRCFPIARANQYLKIGQG